MGTALFLGSPAGGVTVDGADDGITGGWEHHEAPIQVHHHHLTGGAVGLGCCRCGPSYRPVVGSR